MACISRCAPFKYIIVCGRSVQSSNTDGEDYDGQCWDMGIWHFLKCNEYQGFIHIKKVQRQCGENRLGVLRVVRTLETTSLFSLLHSCCSWTELNNQECKKGDFPGGPVVKICLPVQGTRIWSLVWKDSVCCSDASAPQLPSPHSRARVLQLLSPCTVTTEAHTPRACALQQEEPGQQETHCNKDPAQPK